MDKATRRLTPTLHGLFGLQGCSSQVDACQTPILARNSLFSCANFHATRAAEAAYCRNLLLLKEMRGKADPKRYWRWVPRPRRALIPTKKTEPVSSGKAEPLWSAGVALERRRARPPNSARGANRGVLGGQKSWLDARRPWSGW